MFLLDSYEASSFELYHFMNPSWMNEKPDVKGLWMFQRILKFLFTISIFEESFSWSDVESYARVHQQVLALCMR